MNKTIKALQEAEKTIKRLSQIEGSRKRWTKELLQEHKKLKKELPFGEREKQTSKQALQEMRDELKEGTDKLYLWKSIIKEAIEKSSRLGYIEHLDVMKDQIKKELEILEQKLNKINKVLGKNENP